MEASGKYMEHISLASSISSRLLHAYMNITTFSQFHSLVFTQFDDRYLETFYKQQ